MPNPRRRHALLAFSLLVAGSVPCGAQHRGRTSPVRDANTSRTTSDAEALAAKSGVIRGVEATTYTVSATNDSVRIVSGGRQQGTGRPLPVITLTVSRGEYEAFVARLQHMSKTGTKTTCDAAPGNEGYVRVALPMNAEEEGLFFSCGMGSPDSEELDREFNLETAHAISPLSPAIGQFKRVVARLASVVRK